MGHEGDQPKDQVAKKPTSSSSDGAPIVYPDQETGVFEVLTGQSRLSRGLARTGLLLGERIARVVRDDHVYVLLIAAIVGIASGAAAGLLLMWIDRANVLFHHSEIVSSSWGLWVFVAVPAVGGLLVGVLRQFAERYLGQQIHEGVPVVIEAVAHRHGFLNGRMGAILGLGTGLTIGSGGSVGHEGPTVAIGATMGSVVSRFFGLRHRRQVVMVGAGCAAGLAAAFNAPLAGVIFTAEVIFGRAVGGNIGTLSVFTPLIVAAVTGTFVSHAIFGSRPEFEIIAPGSESLVEMVFYLGIALIAGGMSPLMSQIILTVSKGFEGLKLSKWIKPGIGGLLVGIIGALTFSDLLGSGRAIVHDALHHGIGWQIAIALLFLKMLTTALTIGSGGVGGFFMPSLFMGACIGSMIHAVAMLILGEDTSSVASYALVGMGSYLGATLRAPLTPIVMIFELTRDYALILPLMFGCILSSFIAGRVQPDNLYRLLLARRGVRASQAENEAEIMNRARVRDLMVAPDAIIAIDTPLEAIQHIFRQPDISLLYVIDRDQKVSGSIESQSFASAFMKGELSSEATAKELVNAGNSVVTLLPGDTLATAIAGFTASGKPTLPIVDENDAVVGLLHRSDIATHYTNHILARREETIVVSGGPLDRDQEVGLGVGIVLERVVVGRDWSGKTLAQLDLRGKFRVQVLEWTRNENLLAVDPQLPLEKGDVLAVAGKRSAIMAARSSRYQKST